MENPGENVDRNTMFNLVSFFVEGLVLYAHFFVSRLNFEARRFMERFEVTEFFDLLSDKIAEHPPLRYFILAFGLTCIIPVLAFVFFGIITIAITFSGFLFIEGTILAIGGFCLCLCLLSMILTLSLMGLSSCCVYLIIMKLGFLLKKFEATSNIIKRLTPSAANDTVQIPQISQIPQIPQIPQISSLDAHPHQN